MSSQAKGPVRVVGKGDAQREVPITPRLAAILHDYLDTVRPQLVSVKVAGWLRRAKRKGGRVWRTRLPAAIFAVLSALAAGEALAAALEAGGEIADAGDGIGRWFQEWSADGVFVAIELA